MKLGIIIVGYDRYYLLASSLMSLNSCNFKNTRFVYVDDCSPDGRILETWKKFENAEEERGNECKFLRSSEHLGLPGLSLFFRTGIEACSECDLVLFVPDDVIYNPWIYEAIVLSAEKLKNWSAVGFMEDTRGPLFGTIDHVKKYTGDGYHTWGSIDGFLVLMKIETIKKLNWKIDIDEARAKDRSLIWHAISLQTRGKILMTDESLAEHIGNYYNATTKKERADSKKINAVNLNLFGKPEILE